MSGDRTIINTHDQVSRFGGDRIVIYYQRQEIGRMSVSPGYAVHRVVNGTSVETFPEAPWYDHGMKHFLLGMERAKSLKERRAMAREKAIVWACDKFGPRDFVPNRDGDLVEREVNKRFPLPRRPR